MDSDKDYKEITPQLAAQIIEHNRLTHADMAELYDLSLPNLYHWYERRLLGQDIDLISTLLPANQPVQVLDVGTGTGRLALQFVRRGWAVDGVDLSAEMLAVCQTKYDALQALKGQLRLVCGEIGQLTSDLSGPYNILAFSSVLHHLPYYMSVVERLLEVLAPDGIIYITQEPMPADRVGKSIAMRAVQLLDQILRAPQQVRKHLVRIIRKLPRPQGMPLTDYHDRKGLDVDRMLSLLTSQGFEVKRFRRYQDRKTGLVAWLDTHIFHTPNWKFRLVAQKSL